MSKRRRQQPIARDLSRLLEEWPYEPGQLSVRLIEGEDGRPKIQMRIDLGILQMEMDGRPDGKRPEGEESLLEHFETRYDDHVAAGEEPETFALDTEACRRLREEAVQYYHRYIALFVLEEHDLVVRDTTRNLRVLDFCAEHAESDEDRMILEQFRPYILMMRGRALAGAAIRDEEPKAALLAIDRAMDAIRKHFEDVGTPEAFEESSEVHLLRGMREALVPRLPTSPREELETRLRQAVDNENYELAAILRDELRMMGHPAQRSEGA